LHLSWKKILGIVVLLIIIYFAYGALFPSTITISTTRSLSLSLNQTLFVQIYNGTPSALELHSTSATGATFYITKLPVIYNPLVSFSLSPVSSINVSSSGSGVADMNIQLSSSSATGATIQVTPLQTVLGIRTSPSVSLQNPTGLGGAANSGSATTMPTTTASGTSSQATTTAQATTAATTTTVVQNANTVLLQKALTLITQAGIGGVMTGYGKLYAKDVACNQSAYNAAYSYYNSSHKAPSAPFSFENTTPYIPTAVNINETLLSAKNNVKIVYSLATPSPDTAGPAVTAVVNTSSPSFLQSLTFAGLYFGWNTIVLNRTYTFQSEVTGNCGAYIAPPS
jgi:hypothetical protein